MLGGSWYNEFGQQPGQIIYQRAKSLANPVEHLRIETFTNRSYKGGIEQLSLTLEGRSIESSDTDGVGVGNEFFAHAGFSCTLLADKKDDAAMATLGLMQMLNQFPQLGFTPDQR